MRYILIVITAMVISHSVEAQNESNLLQKYIDYATEHNPKLKAMDLKFKQAMEMVPQAKSLPDPNFSAGVFIQPIETRVGAQKAKLSISQMFPWFGTLGAKEKQASLKAHAQYMNYLDAKSRLKMNVTNSWLDLFLTDQKIHFTKKRVEVLDLLEKQSLSRYESNQTDMVNVLYIQMLKEELIAKLELFKDKRETQQLAFNKLLNRDLLTSVETGEDNTFILSHEIVDTEFNLSGHYRINAWNNLRESESFGEKASRLNGLPKLGVGLDYAILSKRTDMDVKDSGKDAIMPMVSVSIPIFRKKYKSAIKVNQLRQVQFEEEKQSELNQLALEKQKATENYKSGIRDSELYEKLLIKVRQSYEILTSSYESSSKRYDEVLNMQQKIWIYEQKKIEAQVLIHKSVAQLKYLGS